MVAHFHGMEGVESSSLFRSTKKLKYLQVANREFIFFYKRSNKSVVISAFVNIVFMQRIIENSKDKSIKNLVRRGFYSGIGWAFGVTVGFALVSTLLVFVLQRLGGIPLIGAWIATLVRATLEQLAERTPILPR